MRCEFFIVKAQYRPAQRACHLPKGVFQVCLGFVYSLGGGRELDQAELPGARHSLRTTDYIQLSIQAGGVCLGRP